MSAEDGMLTDEQALSPKGCGAGTANACFSLTRGVRGFECSLVTNMSLAQISGIRFGWRVNIDQNDQKAWCPLRVLDDSKTE